MNKGSKIIVFIAVAFVVLLLATFMKEAGAGAVMSVAGVAIYILYQAMFKKSTSDKKSDDGKDITLRK